MSSPPVCINLGQYLYFGRFGYDEMWNMVPEPNGWKLGPIVNLDGSISLSLIYLDSQNVEHAVETWDPPISYVQKFKGTFTSPL